MDIDKFRNSQIQIHGLSGLDKIYTFYYNETNNVRKLHVTEKGLNVSELRVFVLGGVAHEGSPQPLDIQALRKDLQLQNNIVDLKLKHLAKGDFLEILMSKKITTFLHWITNNRLLLHYHALDPFYWSIVDIIDSIYLTSKMGC